MTNLQLRVFLHKEPEKILVGKLIQIEHDIYFEYDSHFINEDIQLSPFKLPLKPGVQVDKDRVFAGLHGVFNDSLPDGWGQLLMDRYFRTLDIEPSAISPLERLAYIGHRALGALSYEPAKEIDYKWRSKLTLETLAADCEQILHGKEDDILPELIIAGGSPGGARPKVIVGYDEATQELYSGTDEIPQNYKHYLIKFPTMINLNDSAEVEYAYSMMAKDCGINMPHTRLFSAGPYGNAFGIERFDRLHNQRIHMHTLSGLLHANYRIPNLDYSDYLKATWLLTQNVKEVIQAYRRTVFNILSYNRDDHSKNFSFLLINNQWILSPAYDLTLSMGIAGEHTMTIAGEGANPKLEHLLKIADKSAINKNSAIEIIDTTKAVISNWTSYADQAQVNKNTAAKINKILQNILI